MFRACLVLLCICYAYKTHSQNFISKNQYSLESGLFLSSAKNNPFFARTNKYGEVPFESNFASLRIEAKHEYDSTYTAQRKLEKFAYGYGLRSAMNLGKYSNAVLTEAYAKVRYGVFEMYAGRRRELVGLVDTALSSGSFIWSGNALPIPKAQIGIPNYTPIVKNGLIALKGFYAQGWMGDGDSVKKVLLHQKTFYMRVGKPNWRFRFYGGFNHQVQWGGRPTKPYYDALTEQTISKYGTDFNTYVKVVTGLSLNRKSDGLSTGAPANEALNRAGNHLGSVDIAFEYLGKQNKLFIYRQSFYEDGSLYYLNNIKDGLYGLSWSRPNVKIGITKICLEYLYTVNQGGGGNSYNTIPELRGQDNYFNNSIYKDNWTYRNQIIGTNYFTLARNYAFKDVKPLNYIVINKIEGIYLGVNTQLYKFVLISNFSFSQQQSSLFESKKLPQYYWHQGFKTSLRNVELHAGFSIDHGKVFQNAIGLYGMAKYIIR